VQPNNTVVENGPNNLSQWHPSPSIDHRCLQGNRFLRKGVCSGMPTAQLPPVRTLSAARLWRESIRQSCSCLIDGSRQTFRQKEHWGELCKRRGRGVHRWRCLSGQRLAEEFYQVF